MGTHCMSATEEMAAHTHELGDWVWAVSSHFNSGTYNIQKQSSGNATPYAYGKTLQKVYTLSSGKDVAHNNIQPVIASYIWSRTA